MTVKKFDDRDFIVISIDSRSKLSKKKKKKKLRDFKILAYLPKVFRYNFPKLKFDHVHIYCEIYKYKR
jgi:hypothetical protein